MREVTVTDPRSEFYVSFGLWPDCPRCQGLLGPKYEYIAPPKGSFGGHYNLIVPCSDCLARSTQAESPVLSQFHQNGRGAPYGTWPNCPKCHGQGGRRYESGYDGHRSDYTFADCRACQNRTAEYHRAHPTDLDRLLDSQRAELQLLLDLQKKLESQLVEVRRNIEDLTKTQQDALQPYVKRVRQAHSQLAR